MPGLITFALFIGVIWLKIVVFGIVGDAIGVLLTIIGVFVTAAIGIRLFRASGRATMARMQESVKAGRPLYWMLPMAWRFCWRRGCY